MRRSSGLLLPSILLPLLSAVLLLSLALLPQPSHSQLVHWLPLQGSYVDNANASTVVNVAGGSECASFQAVSPAPSAWTQTCNASSNPATVGVQSPVESGDVSLCVYVNVAVWGEELNYLFSCDSFSVGGVDCVEVRYDAQWGLLTGRLNVIGLGNSGVLTLSTHTWYHICATYSSSLHLLLIYVDSLPVTTVNVAHTNSTFGAPILAGEGGNQGNPIQGSFINFRQYSVALTQVQIANLTASDCPGCTVPGLTTATSASAPAVSSTASATPASRVSSTPGLFSTLSTQGIPGPVLWLSAETIPAAPNGTRVSIWPDLTGNGNAALQSTPSLQPLLILNATAGLRVVRFLGQQDMEFVSGVFPKNSSWTFMCLLTPQSTSTQEALFLAGSTATPDHAFIIYAPNSTSGLFTVFDDINAGSVAAATSIPVSATGVPFLFTVVFSLPLQTIFLYQNGSLQATLRDTGATESTFAIGRGFYAGSQYLGDIAELLLFNSSLSNSSRLYLETNLATLYGIPYPFPPTPAVSSSSGGVSSLSSPTSTVGSLLRSSSSPASLSPSLSSTASSPSSSVSPPSVSSSGLTGGAELVPALITQLAVRAINNRQQMGFTWASDPIATSYQLTVQTPDQPNFVTITTNASYASSSFLNPNLTYTAAVLGIGPTGILGPSSVPVSFTGVLPLSSYTSAYPRGIVRPYIWLVADTILTFYSNGSQFATWEDVSLNNNSMSQPSTTSQPLVEANQVNGHAAVLFSNTFNDSGTYVSTQLAPVPSSLTFSMVINVAFVPLDGAFNDAFLGLDLPLPLFGSPAVVTAVWFNVGSGTETVFYFNGVLAGFGFGPALNETSSTAIELGALVNGLYPFFGQCMEFMAFNQAISDTSRAQVEAYLANKYQILVL